MTCGEEVWDAVANFLMALGVWGVISVVVALAIGAMIYAVNDYERNQRR